LFNFKNARSTNVYTVLYISYTVYNPFVVPHCSTPDTAGFPPSNIRRFIFKKEKEANIIYSICVNPKM